MVRLDGVAVADQSWIGFVSFLLRKSGVKCKQDNQALGMLLLERVDVMKESEVKIERFKICLVQGEHDVL